MPSSVSVSPSLMILPDGVLQFSPVDDDDGDGVGDGDDDGILRLRRTSISWSFQQREEYVDTETWREGKSDGRETTEMRGGGGGGG